MKAPGARSAPGAKIEPGVNLCLTAILCCNPDHMPLYWTKE